MGNFTTQAVKKAPILIAISSAIIGHKFAKLSWVNTLLNSANIGLASYSLTTNGLQSLKNKKIVQFSIGIGLLGCLYPLYPKRMQNIKTLCALLAVQSLFQVKQMHPWSSKETQNSKTKQKLEKAASNKLAKFNINFKPDSIEISPKASDQTQLVSKLTDKDLKSLKEIIKEKYPSSYIIVILNDLYIENLNLIELPHRVQALNFLNCTVESFANKEKMTDLTYKLFFSNSTFSSQNSLENLPSDSNIVLIRQDCTKLLLENVALQGTIRLADCFPLNKVKELCEKNTRITSNAKT